MASSIPREKATVRSPLRQPGSRPGNRQKRSRRYGPHLNVGRCPGHARREKNCFCVESSGRVSLMCLCATSPRSARWPRSAPPCDRLPTPSPHAIERYKLPWRPRRVEKRSPCSELSPPRLADGRSVSTCLRRLAGKQAGKATRCGALMEWIPTDPEPESLRRFFRE